MFDYGNPLGNALMMQTYLNGLMIEFEQQEKGFTPPAKKPLFGKKKPEPQNTSMADWLKSKDCSCYLCDRIEDNMNRYYATFFVLL